MYFIFYFSLIGESQNSGLLLTILSELFEKCHDRELEDDITIKIACSVYRDGKFSDAFGTNEEEVEVERKMTRIDQTQELLFS
jgi:hypothetical protein